MPQTLDTADSVKPETDRETCRICRRQVSRYTCPSCNIPYCSISCFRSDAHSQCSETFYKRELESEIRSKPSVDVEERKRMLELLRNFEQEEGKNSLEDLEEDEEDNDLAARLADIDLESVSPSRLWEVLTPEERSMFMKSIEDPTSAQSLLRSAAFEGAIISPWWDDPQIASVSLDSEGLQGRTELTPMQTFGKKPALISIPDQLLRRPPGPDTGPPLLYNICAVLVAYAFITRHLAMSPLASLDVSDPQEDMVVIRDFFKTLTPFLVEKRSQTLLTSMDDITTDFWGKLVQTGKTSRDSFPLLLRDAAFLLSPKRVTELSGPLQQTIVTSSQYTDLSSHLHVNAILALSDIFQFFQLAHVTKRSEVISANPEKSKETPTSHRIRFYAAYITMLPSPILGSFAKEVAARASSVEEETQGVSRDSDNPDTHAIGTISLEKQEGIKTTNRPIIEEI